MWCLQSSSSCWGRPALAVPLTSSAERICWRREQRWLWAGVQPPHDRGNRADHRRGRDATQGSAFYHVECDQPFGYSMINVRRNMPCFMPGPLLTTWLHLMHPPLQKWGNQGLWHYMICPRSQSGEVGDKTPKIHQLGECRTGIQCPLTPMKTEFIQLELAPGEQPVPQVTRQRGSLVKTQRCHSIYLPQSGQLGISLLKANGGLTNCTHTNRCSRTPFQNWSLLKGCQLCLVTYIKSQRPFPEQTSSQLPGGHRGDYRA